MLLPQRKSGSNKASARHHLAQKYLVEALNIGASLSRNTFTDMPSTSVTSLDQENLNHNKKQKAHGFLRLQRQILAGVIVMFSIILLRQFQKNLEQHIIAEPVQLPNLKNVTFFVQTWIRQKK